MTSKRPLLPSLSGTAAIPALAMPSLTANLGTAVHTGSPGNCGPGSCGGEDSDSCEDSDDDDGVFMSLPAAISMASKRPQLPTLNGAGSVPTLATATTPSLAILQTPSRVVDPQAPTPAPAPTNDSEVAGTTGTAGTTAAQLRSERALSEARDEHELHVLALTLLLRLAVRPDGAGLDRLYSDDYPLQSPSVGFNLLFRLQRFLSSRTAARRAVVRETAQRLDACIARLPPSADGVTRSCVGAPRRLLQLLAGALFDQRAAEAVPASALAKAEKAAKAAGHGRSPAAAKAKDGAPRPVSTLSLIARGAFASVYSCTNAKGASVAAKLLDTPRGEGDRCVLHALFEEVTILEALDGSAQASRLLCYGLADDAYWVVLEHAATSLKQWRRQCALFGSGPGGALSALPLCLCVFLQVLRATKAVHERGVAHYDLKCDNVLLRSEPADATAQLPEDTVCLADFGVALLGAGTHALETFNRQSRGTEVIKSPEMLMVAEGEHSMHDRRRKAGTNCASDVWSLGCLLYELLTGEFLFSDQDYVGFFLHVTGKHKGGAEQGGGVGSGSRGPSEVVGGPKLARLAELLDGEGGKATSVVAELLQFVLVRDALRRPGVDEVIAKASAAAKAANYVVHDR